MHRARRPRNGELEQLAASLVLDGDEHVIRARVPQQPDVDAIVRAVIKLADR